MSYDKFARPQNNATKVAIGMTIKHVDFDEATSIFTVYAWFFMEWNDEKLKWNKSQYGNLSKLGLAQHEIWQPDVTLYNSISPNFDLYGTAHFVVEPDGKVLWVPPAIFKVLCDSNLRDWPFDSHQCNLIFGSWIYDGHEIELERRESIRSDIELYVENSEWDITTVQVGRTVKFYSCCPEPYMDVQYNITIARRSSIFQSVILAPGFIVIILTLLTFWLPAQYGEKIFLNGIVALIIVLFLLYISQNLNIMASHTPLIVLFYNHALYMVCFSTLISVVVINLTRLKHQRILPWFVKKHLDGKFGTLLLLDHINDTESDQHTSRFREHSFDEPSPNDAHQFIQQCRSGNSSLKRDYMKLATAIDRIGFILYLFIFIVFSIAYSV